MTEKRLRHLLEAAPQATVCVVGDFCLDQYLYIDAERDEPSLETGLTAYQVTGRRHSPGGAGNVCANLVALGARVRAVGLLGDDGEGYVLRRELDRLGVNTEGLLTASGRCTNTYTKPMRTAAEGYAEQNRLDVKNYAPPSPEQEAALLQALRQAAAASDAVLAVDQFEQPECGTVGPALKAELGRLALRRPSLVVYADSRAFIHTFVNCIIKCNNFEAVRAVLPQAEGDGNVQTAEACGAELCRRTGRTVYVTLGGEGMAVCTPQGTVRVPAAKCPGPYDFCGAGDTASAGIVLALACGATAEEAAWVGNLAASVTIQQVGVTGTASPESVLARFAACFGQDS